MKSKETSKLLQQHNKTNHEENSIFNFANIMQFCLAEKECKTIYDCSFHIFGKWATAI